MKLTWYLIVYDKLNYTFHAYGNIIINTHVHQVCQEFKNDKMPTNEGFGNY
jgi:hypothetical protein